MERSPVRRSKRNQPEGLVAAIQSSGSLAKIAATSAKAAEHPSAPPPSAMKLSGPGTQPSSALPTNASTFSAPQSSAPPSSASAFSTSQSSASSFVTPHSSAPPSTGSTFIAPESSAPPPSAIKLSGPGTPPSSTPPINASAFSVSPANALPSSVMPPPAPAYSAPLTGASRHRDPQHSIQQFNVPSYTAKPSSALPASGLQASIFDQTHQVSDFTSNPIHVNANPNAAASVGVSASVNLATSEFAPVIATTMAPTALVNATTTMPTATVNALAPSQMDILYIMQQQISMLELQLKFAQAQISEGERQRIATVPPHSTPPVASATQPTYIYAHANGSISALPHAPITTNRSSVDPLNGQPATSVQHSCHAIAADRQPASHNPIDPLNGQPATSVQCSRHLIATNTQPTPQTIFEPGSSDEIAQ
ncbi:PREDICTED: nuclear pore complex protein DDB_G0274915-like [Rhagoletis zephyria]|uniref:nuclear pore complex protein DDB_G0274915-like n=1 Tax=Rhagoletis zephyria TaxID=28612 RepID=UPI000811548F|nr:PREDICTED: nuclear pore complex protein DDB_G0274915-like [Rhagoletis zephyria]